MRDPGNYVAGFIVAVFAVVIISIPIVLTWNFSYSP